MSTTILKKIKSRSYFVKFDKIKKSFKFYRPGRAPVISKGTKKIGKMDTTENAIFTLAVQYRKKYKEFNAGIQAAEVLLFSGKKEMQRKSKAMCDEIVMLEEDLYDAIKERFAGSFAKIMKNSGEQRLTILLYCDFSINVYLSESGISLYDVITSEPQRCGDLDCPNCSHWHAQAAS